MPNTTLIQTADFAHLFSVDVPLIDTRAPVEFKQGAFPRSQNLMLMSDEERKRVGICYKEQGQESAINLGRQLVKGSIKGRRIQAWIRFVKNNPDGALYCFRGGLRSKIAQQWIYASCGIDYPRIEGGYKALRRFLIEATNSIMQQITPIVIGGQTGCGKTLLLHQFSNTIDLEGLANHRGSAFGAMTMPQPTQINFENALAIELIKKQHKQTLLFEDEGSNIGVLQIPSCVREKTAQAELILLEADIDSRIEVIMNTYVVKMQQEFIAQDRINGFNNFSQYWLKSLQKIQKRLGLKRYKTLSGLVNKALLKYKEQGDITGFYPILEDLLMNYYDPMYNYQIKQKRHRVIFKGSKDEVLQYLLKKFV